MDLDYEIKDAKQMHFVNRLLARFGIRVSKSECSIIIEGIENYEPYPLLVDPETGRSFHRVMIQNQSVIVLYDWEYKTLLTCYHSSWLVLVDGKWEMRAKSLKKFIRRRNKTATSFKKQGFTFI